MRLCFVYDQTPAACFGHLFIHRRVHQHLMLPCGVCVRLSIEPESCKVIDETMSSTQNQTTAVCLYMCEFIKLHITTQQPALSN